ncbi:uncharacterized protein LOC136027192 [Artemia franciscana]|uniref:uncharacterized protein LOC136027192 n=1 Tax=Artemia franciscana TaxID=6661 RepID=UPI0032DAB6E2
MATAVLRTFKGVQPHIPLIKFRKSGLPKVPESTGQYLATPNIVPQAPKQEVVLNNPKMTASTVLQDFEVPMRYRRKPLTQEEIDCINMGGAQ